MGWGRGGQTVKCKTEFGAAKYGHSKCVLSDAGKHTTQFCSVPAPMGRGRYSASKLWPPRRLPTQ